ncbi:MAG: DUF3800 domain-containing protein [Flavipsychrobacter sp.]|nr:DUF3800 domain-containing protein [Flavipsychrobacter sp.]
MFLSYFDESGDDGYPQMSSELFVLANLYMHESNWKRNYEGMHGIRKMLKAKYGLNVSQEFHTKEFITDKNPYHGLFTPQQRKEMLFDYCRGLATLNFKLVTVCINKRGINRPEYEVLEKALTYSVQRIENDLTVMGDDARFMIITDEGRVAAMRRTTRMIQKINYVPSMLDGTPIRKDIKKLIEDPLSKNSKDSYFIQAADLLAFIMQLYCKTRLCNPKIEWGKRIKNVLAEEDLLSLLAILKPIFNLKASYKNEYGVVFYPK